MTMYTQCHRCKELFFGESLAWSLTNKPYCAGCFNELAYGTPTKVRPEDIPLTPEPQDPMGLNGLFPPPTMG